MDASPFYADWKFWSVVVSIIAIALSQLPPIHMMLRRAKLEIEAYSRIVIGHKAGNPNVQLHLILSNVGGREVKIKSMSLTFKRGKEDNFSLPAQNFFATPTDKESVLLPSFKLKPNEEWAHVTGFLNFFSRTEEKEYRQIESDIRTDIFKKRTQLDNQEEVVEAASELVQPLLTFFDKKFRWHPGEYEIQLLVQAVPGSASISKKFRVTLFESDSKELQDHKDGYKFGAGVYFDLPKHVPLILPLVSREG